MNRCVPVLLGLSGLLFAPGVWATPERVESILEDLRLHGYHSPSAAVERLQSASDVPSDNAPLDLRRSYHAELAELSITAGQPALTLTTLAKLEAMVERENCKPCRIDALLVQTEAALERGEVDQAKRKVAQARELTPPDDLAARVRLAYVDTRVHEARGELAAAIEQAVPAVTLAEQIGNTADRIRLMVQLVGFNADLGHLERAKSIAEEGIALAQRIGFDDAAGFLYLNLGHIHSLGGDHDAQYRALTNALAITEGDPGLSTIEVTSRSNLADYYLYRGDYRAALDHATRAAELARRIGDKRGLTVSLANQGIALGHLDDTAGGVAKLQESIALAESIGHKGYVVGITHELVLLLEAAGRYREALDATQKVAALNQEITRQEREKAVMELQEKYETERKSREIERLSAENRLKEAEVRASTWQQRLWAAVAVVLLLAAYPVVRRLLRAHRVNRRLKMANANLAEQSTHDPLTGAFNRRHFHTLTERYTSENIGHSTEDVRDTIGLILLDIDHFKAINDTHGHPAGDAVLVEVARRLQKLVRDQDAVVRWGGEEFVLVLPGTRPQGLAVLATRLLRMIGSEPVRANGAAIQVTASAGCVAFPVTAQRKWDDALQIADAAMYRAKQQGRNRAVCVLDMGAEISPEAVAADLVAAEAAGAVSLVMLPGPSRPVVVDAAAGA